ncbi:CTP synthetase [archaeon]|nr:CTP synthetase [archaeon]|tara:strand:+ start:880 stop:2691 length:1812 start_codon:yes stop_codon:yes gene_type:complete
MHNPEFNENTNSEQTQNDSFNSIEPEEKQDSFEDQQTQETLRKSATKTDDDEFYHNEVPGYIKGRTKFVFVMGTVISGLGKGVFSSSLAKLLQNKGFTVEPMKIEGYLNIDSGTLNPFRHGEVFVLDDGLETDMDLGTYERLLSKNLTRENYLTSGQIFMAVLTKERQGGYLGKDIQVIPHVTGEIKTRFRQLAVQKHADIVFVEVGGTVGDLENSHYLEAIREFAYEEGRENCCFVALTYVIKPNALGEQKSKAAQHGIKKLMSRGIQPDVIAIRADDPVGLKVRQKISINSNVPVERVVSMHDVDSIYKIPKLLHNAGIDKYVCEMLGFSCPITFARDEKWERFLSQIESQEGELVIGITGKYTQIRDAYASLIHALQHATTACGRKLRIKWIETTEIELGQRSVESELVDVAGIVVPGGFGTRGVEGKIACVKYAREKGMPYLGLCYGFQMAVVEYARNVCGLTGAHSTEVTISTPHKVIDILPEQKKIEGLGGNMRLGGRDVEVSVGSFAYSLYGNRDTVRERFRHRYEVDPKYISTLEEHGLVFSGKAPGQPIMQILELPQSVHPFFIGVQYHPEFISRPTEVHPLFLGFVKACLRKI